MSKGLERLKNNNLPCSNCKELKAFAIIKEKNVAITMIKQTDCVEEYNQFAYGFIPIKEIKSEKYTLSPQPLEREEFDLLKEVLS